jgi:hypothetical protein
LKMNSIEVENEKEEKKKPRRKKWQD